MAKAIRLNGYFGETNGGTTQGAVTVTYVLHGTTETLSVLFEGRYQVDVPFRQISVLAAQARLGLAWKSSCELELQLNGYYSDSLVRLRSGVVNVWFRCNRSVEMLTLSFEQKEQISLPYAPVAAMVNAERSWTV